MSDTERSPDSICFWDHVDAAGQIIDFLAPDNITLEGKQVADIGCGDGIIDLALATKARPSELVGFDVNLTDAEHLLARASAEGFADQLPPGAALRPVRSHDHPGSGPEL